MATPVNILQTHIVTGSEPSVLAAIPDPLPSSPLDHLTHPCMPINAVFAYQYQSRLGNLQNFMCIDRLLAVLPLLLDHYPQLCGRFINIPTDGSTALTDFRAGMHVIEARTDARMDSLSTHGPGKLLSLPRGGSALVPNPGRSLADALSGPIFAIQHTRFACGSVAIGVAMSHKVADASSMFQVMRDLSRLYRTPDSERARLWDR